jgi:drug/metabolite transporter (DMT)-like permease
MFDIFFYLFLFFSVFFEIGAQYLFKLVHNKKIYNNSYLSLFNFTNNKNIFLLSIGIIFYALTGFFAFKILKYGELGIINIIWHLLHFFILFFIGYFLLGERLNLNKKIGSIFGIIAIIFFMIDGHNH